MDVWADLLVELRAIAADEPALAEYLQCNLLQCGNFHSALAAVLAAKLASRVLAFEQVLELLLADGLMDEGLAVADLRAAASRDPAARSLSHPFLNHKGFHALQTHRVAHACWRGGRQALALYLQSRCSEVFAVDIHPAARLGSALFIDHATGVVIGETAVVGDDVSILQDVTLGGTGKEAGDRHPKVGARVLVCAGVKILGNIRIGDDAVIGAGSVVLEDVPAHATVVGVPARVVRVPNGARAVLPKGVSGSRQLAA
ncbi:serine O-acetyltransferase [Rugamonas sp. A1-17]|nr:serine O-acetyltransferase [Rugamonas sp. A1-17]